MTRVRAVLFPVPALFFMLALRVGAQEETAHTLESLRISGNKAIPAEKILAVCGLKTGQPVTKADFDAARQRLDATGAFVTVGYEYKPRDPESSSSGFDAVIEVHEIDNIYPYRFEDLLKPEGVLREALRAQEPLWGDEIPVESIERYVDTITQQGVGIAVTAKMERSPEGALAIVFRPASMLSNVAEVTFKGNDALPAATLLRAINAAAIGIPYTEKELRARLDEAIRPLYDARGRIRVAFPKLVVERAKELDGVNVVVTVEEGPVYTLGEVSITGVPAEDTAGLLRSADLKKRDTANFDDVRAAVERIEKKYRENGYLHVSSKVDRDVHDAEHTVNVAIALDLGAQYRFGKLEIKGLDLLTEPEIRKAWGQMEGRPYQPGYANAFLDRLRAEKVFDNLGKTLAEPHIDEASKVVDVTLTFSVAGKAETDSAVIHFP
ncbi:MAG TPA: POTRA domain-containing protein [Bryobacteraceae bacterium]|jgi:outer membrane protein assembly factor BamA